MDGGIFLANFSGTPGNDDLFGTSGNDTINGYAGNDFLTPGSGTDVVSGGAGDDRVFLSSDIDYFTTQKSFIDGDQGIDTLDFSAAGGPNFWSLDQNTGLFDVADVSFQNFEVLIGGYGKDSFSFLNSMNNWTIFGGSGDDTVVGGGGSLTFYGGSGADYILPGFDSNILFGDSGDDTINAIRGTGSIDGGSGVDTIISGSVDLSIGYGSGYSVSNVENVRLTEFDWSRWAIGNDLNNRITVNDSSSANEFTLDGRGGDDYLAGAQSSDILVGREGNDTLIGYAGADWLVGGTGNDDLQGGSGNDVLIGGLGTDSLDGGSGDDVAYYRDAASSTYAAAEGARPLLVEGHVYGVMVDTATPTNGFGEGSGDSLTNVENIWGSNFDDVIFGADDIGGQIFGFAGDDVLAGRGGNDVFYGGPGSDYLIGGEGADDFFYLSYYDHVNAFGTPEPNELGDTITDFATGIDRIIVSRYWFGFGNIEGPAASLTDTNAAFISDGSTPTDARPAFLWDAEADTLHYDPDGSGSSEAVYFATFQGTVLFLSDIWTA